MSTLNKSGVFPKRVDAAALKVMLGRGDVGVIARMRLLSVAGLRKFAQGILAREGKTPAIGQ